MTGGWVPRMGWSVGVAGVLLTLTAHSVEADIYRRVDRFGVIHFTNVPTDSRYKLVMRDPPRVPRWSGASAAARPGRAESRAYDPIIADVAQRFQVERALVKAVIKAESGFQANAISPKGARGLMQLMPATAIRHGVRHIHEPQENIEGGVQHLRMLLDRYNGDVVLALAAYNAGEAWVDQYGTIPPIQETQDYVRRVLRFRQDYLHQAIASAR